MKKLFIIFLLLSFLSITYAANPFFAGKKNEATEKVDSYVKSKPFLWLMKVQRQLNQRIATASRDVKTDWWKLFPLIASVFAYGVIHALGPGHGKVFSVFYFMSEKISIPRGMSLSMMVGALHGLMGILLVLVLKYFLQIYSYLLQQNVENIIQKVSFLLISLLGFYFILKKIYSKKNQAEHLAGKSGFALALSVAMVPCPGVVMVMLFCISAGALPLGLVLSGFMSLGMGITIASIGLCTLLLKNFSLGWLEQKSVLQVRVVIEYMFAILLFLYGLFLFLSSF